MLNWLLGVMPKSRVPPLASPMARDYARPEGLLGGGEQANNSGALGACS
jgi:hypothetical protein